MFPVILGARSGGGEFEFLTSTKINFVILTAVESWLISRFHGFDGFLRHKSSKV